MTAEPTISPAGNGIQVIGRAGQILRALAEERDGLGLSELAARVALPRSTVYRILAALDTEGLVALTSPRGRYVLGPELIRLARTEHRELRAAARPLLELLSEQVNEAVDLSILIGARVAFIDHIEAPQSHSLRAVSAVGASLPAHCTANGLALLAAHTDGQLMKVVPARLARFTPSTMTTRSDLLEEIARVRSDGYAIVREEHTLGISAIGAAVHDGVTAVAAVSVPVPTPRFEGREQLFVAALLRTCGQISELLGPAWS